MPAVHFVNSAVSREEPIGISRKYKASLQSLITSLTGNIDYKKAHLGLAVTTRRRVYQRQALSSKHSTGPGGVSGTHQSSQGLGSEGELWHNNRLYWSLLNISPHLLIESHLAHKATLSLLTSGAFPILFPLLS